MDDFRAIRVTFQYVSIHFSIFTRPRHICSAVAEYQCPILTPKLLNLQLFSLEIRYVSTGLKDLFSLWIVVNPTYRFLGQNDPKTVF